MRPVFETLTQDPVGSLADYGSERLEFLAPYTEWQLANALLRRVKPMVCGLDASIRLVAVHTSPFPSPSGCAVPAHAFLAEQLSDLASHCNLSVRPEVVLSRFWDEGFQYVLPPHSTILIGSWRRPWRTREDRLARTLSGQGHHVLLFHLDKNQSPVRGFDSHRDTRGNTFLVAQTRVSH